MYKCMHEHITYIIYTVSILFGNESDLIFIIIAYFSNKN